MIPVEIGIKFENVLSLFLPVFLRLSLILLVFLTLFDSGLLIPPLLSPFFSFTLCFTPSFILLLLLLPPPPSSFSFLFLLLFRCERSACLSDGIISNSLRVLKSETKLSLSSFPACFSPSFFILLLFLSIFNYKREDTTNKV